MLSFKRLTLIFISSINNKMDYIKKNIKIIRAMNLDRLLSKFYPIHLNWELELYHIHSLFNITYSI